MKKLILFSTLLLIGGCQSLPKVSQQTLQASTVPTGCSEKATNVLTKPETIELNSQSVTKSGQISAAKSIGYTFAAQAGQKLSYRTQDDICIWIYTPENQLLTSGEIPQSGKYILQVSAPRGSTTFNLEMSLGTLEASSSTFTTTTDNSSSRVQPERPSADEFVKDYYSNINNRQYSDAWSKLSPSFQSKSSSYSEYTKWWDSVKEIQIGDAHLINQSSDLAVVSIELWYAMNNGQVF